MVLPVILRSKATKNPNQKRFLPCRQAGFVSLRMTEKRFETASKKKFLKGKKILITCGPTWVPIDSVRVISNCSTGEMGHLIAKDLKRFGAQITLIEGPVTHMADLKSIKVIKFQFYDDLVKTLKEQLRKKYDVIIHAAAVSDYRLKNSFSRKINSDQASVHLQMVPTEKIIHWIKRLNPKAFLVGFKLETGWDLKRLKQKAADLTKKAGCDLVVANSFANQRYQGYILDKQQNVLLKGKSRLRISRGLAKILCHQK